MIALFKRLFRKKPVWPYCTIKHVFPAWPNHDISQCGEVTWDYTPIKR